MNSFFSYIKERFFFLMSFTFCKAIVFLVPLVLAEVLSKDNFGILEYALAGLGMVLNTTINLGIPGAYPFFKLRQKSLSILKGFDIHFLWLLLLFLVNQFCYFIYDSFSIEYYMALNIAYIVANQVFISTKLKTDDKIIKAIFFDSGVYLILLAFVGLNYLGLTKNTIDNINLFIQVYAVVFALLSISKLFNIKKRYLVKYFRILKFSYSILFSSILIFFITVSGRFLIEFFFKDFELVGIYSFYFRLAAIVVMIYQVISISFFKKIYTLEPRILDKYFAAFFIGLYVISMFSFYVSSYIVPFFSDYYNDTILAYKSIYFILSVQVVFWISSALTSNIIDREELAKKISIVFTVLIFFFIAILYVFKDALTIELYTIMHFIVIFIATMAQFIVLFRKKIFFIKTMIVLSILFLLTITIFKIKY